MNRHLTAAVALATTAAPTKYRHAAIAVKRGQVVAHATNLTRHTHPSNSDWRVASIHAEERVLRQLGSTAAGATLYIARVNRGGEPRNSQPCRRCQGQLDRAGVRRVAYT